MLASQDKVVLPWKHCQLSKRPQVQKFIQANRREMEEAKNIV
ncbi:hypothetical protein [Nostoc sp. FACHB-892]|nr:hypothetical protein [Nostoc sp. FACHB-892]